VRGGVFFKEQQKTGGKKQKGTTPVGGQARGGTSNREVENRGTGH